MSSPFIQAMDKTNHLQSGENGSTEYTASGVEDSRVALFFALVRDIPAERLHDLLQTVVRDGKDNEEIIADLFLMVFQTRHCRGGKGEKDLFYRMIIELSSLYPKTTSSLISLVPHYGSYKDWFRLIEWSRDEKKIPQHELRNAMTTVVDTIMNLVCDQLNEDRQVLEKGKALHKISLLAKWAPKEGKSMDKLAKELAIRLFPHSTRAKKEYRQLLSRLNASINTVEVKMSNNEWDTIDFTKDVPSLSLMKYRKAFLNEVVKGRPPLGGEDETGNRHPDDEVRVACRKRLRETMLSEKAEKLKGKQLFPHEIVNKFMGGRNQLSTLEKDIFSCQWNDIRKNVVEAMEKVKQEMQQAEETSSAATVDLGKMVSLVDVSGSMSGIPMQVAIALGVLVSEIASPAYANRCLTFSATPNWVELDSSMPIGEKVQKMMNAPWGMNTNFEAATEKILKVAVKAKLSPEDIPDLIVFSDMQFDQAKNDSRGWKTHHKRIVRRFKEEGLRVCGKEWPAPHIIYWNLRGNTTGFPAKASTPGVTMLSGYSPSLMKLLLSGDPMEEEEEVVDENGVKTKKMKNNPFLSIRKALDSEDYDKVREVLYASNEGVLQKYIRKDEAMVTVEEDKVSTSQEDKKDEWEMVA
jgi:hypothetical protein